MPYRRQRSQTAGDIFLNECSKDGESRVRSSSLSPRIRKVTINDATEDAFQIPATEVTEYTEKRARASTVIEDIDLSMYNDNTVAENKIAASENFLAVKNTGFLKKPENGELGTLSGYVNYDSQKHRLKICYNELLIHRRPFVKHQRPFENSIYSNEGISMEERVTVEIIYAKNTSRRKISFFKSNAQSMYRLSAEREQNIRFKSRHPSQYLLKFTVFPKHSKNLDDLAVGTVLLPMKKVMESNEAGVQFEESIYDRTKIDSCKHGEIHTSLTWNDQIDLFQIELKKIDKLLITDNSKEKQLYLKITIYTDGFKFTELTSDVYTTKLANDVCTPRKSVEIRQRFFIEIKEKQIKRSFISIQLYEKHLINSACVGKSIITPYMLPDPNMSPDVDGNTYSCWEKVLMFPYETVDYICELYKT